MPPPILRDFPDEFETERLLIRSPMPGDGEEKRRAVSESLESLKPWLNWVQREPTPGEAEVEVREARVRFLERTDLRMLLFDRESGELVGAAACNASSGRYRSSRSGTGAAPGSRAGATLPRRCAG